jgi:hypothetical protein
MCKASTPEYTPPAKVARAKEPDNAALFEQAQARAQLRGGGAKRSTMLTGLRGTAKPPVLGEEAKTRQPATALG